MGIRPHKKQQYLESPEMCLRRIEDRVRSGGHNIPEDTVRRRYQRSLAMFARTYSNLIPNWYLFDNSNGAALVIAQKEDGEISIADQGRYGIIQSYGYTMLETPVQNRQHWT